MTARADVRTKRTRVAPAVAILFGLLYAYDLWEAVSNLIALPAQLADYNEFLIDNGLAPLAVPWVILIGNLMLPPAVFALAWLMGRRRTLALQALLYVLGLAVVAALSLTLRSLLG